MAIQHIANLMPLEKNAGLGTSKVCLNSNRTFVLAGHFDEQLRIYNILSLREMFVFDHSL